MLRDRENRDPFGRKPAISPGGGAERLGGIPRMYVSQDPKEDLRSCTDLYSKEEIQAEAMVRRVDHFARFMDVIGIQSGLELN